MPLAHCKSSSKTEDSYLSLTLVIVSKLHIFLILIESHFKEHNSHLNLIKGNKSRKPPLPITSHTSKSFSLPPSHGHTGPVPMLMQLNPVWSTEILTCKSWSLFLTDCFWVVNRNKASPKLWLHDPAQETPMTNGPVRSPIPGFANRNQAEILLPILTSPWQLHLQAVSLAPYS